MPRLIGCAATRSIDLETCIERIAADGFDARCEKSLNGAATALRELGNNRHFLAEYLTGQLRNRHRNVEIDSDYSPQAIVLSPAQNGFFLRANIWPSPRDKVLQASGGQSFAYEMPHDHNFDFLTLGYFGPGYASDYWEYDYAGVAGYAGEVANLRFLERRTLHPGTLMHYRAHRDVHSQLPPESLSVSLNVMATEFADGWKDQYSFDPASDTITGIINPNSTETFLRAAIAFGNEGAIELAQDFGRSHPSERLRLASYEARSLQCETKAERDELWREAELAGSRMLACVARAKRAELA